MMMLVICNSHHLKFDRFPNWHAKSSFPDMAILPIELDSFLNVPIPQGRVVSDCFDDLPPCHFLLDSDSEGHGGRGCENLEIEIEISEIRLRPIGATSKDDQRRTFR